MHKPNLESDLRPHQKQALSKLKNGSILWGAVGTGKGRVALAYYIKHEAPRNIIVITTAKKRDSLEWDKEAAHYAISQDEDVTYYGRLIVDSWNNIEKYKDHKNFFFIFDEQRLVGSGTWVKAFLRIARNNRWILLSATPGDTWLDYCPVFVANGFYKNRTAFKREHVVYAPHTKFPKVDRYLGTQKLERLRDDILVHMPFQKDTIRREKTVYVDYDDVVLQNVTESRWNLYRGKPVMNIAELFMVMRRVVNEDASRLRALTAILRDHNRVIVFYNFDYELEALKRLQQYEKWGYKLAQYNGHKHEPLPESDRWIYLVQYAAGSEGWECTSTDAMVFYSLTYSYKMWEQAHGRIDRMNTPYQDLYYYTLRSKSWIDYQIWRSLKAKKSFQPGKHSYEELKNPQIADKSAKISDS